MPGTVSLATENEEQFVHELEENLQISEDLKKEWQNASIGISLQNAPQFIELILVKLRTQFQFSGRIDDKGFTIQVFEI